MRRRHCKSSWTCSTPLSLIGLYALIALSVGCGGGGEEIVLDDALGLDIVLTQGSDHPGVDMAANDLITSFAKIRKVARGQGNLETSLGEADAPLVVEVQVDGSLDLPEQGAILSDKDFGQGRKGVLVRAKTPVGAMYGLYEIDDRWGVQYIHPEQTVYPAQDDLVLPSFSTAVTVAPSFTTRGFHEHTQHPIPTSDIMLRGEQAYRQYASNYLRWLARNRQNAASVHMLKTIDLSPDAWPAYYKGVVEEGHGMGIKMGLVVSFADEQQNNFRLIAEEAGAGGGDVDESIRVGLDTLAGIGFDFFTFQQATSEFTQSPVDELLGWFATAMTFLDMAYPEVETLTWVHPPCDLETEDGENFWHTPEKAPAELGFMVHTTMYYTAFHPAPVYGCEEFKHQEALMARQDGKRRMVFFPETAWWLGFDNNMPLTLPITGWSRAYDIQEILSKYDVEGHITFTTGREWLYWQYDHYLTQVTWDETLTWEQYLESIKGVYGSEGDRVVEVIGKWTDLQVKHFYNENPLIYFYLSGELLQDEIGEKAGVLARRPKISYSKVLEMTDQEFASWNTTDLDMLKRMKQEYAQVFDGVPSSLAEGSDSQKELYREFFVSHDLYLKRIDHSIALYEGVAALRPWFVEQAQARTEGREPDETIKTAAQDTATQKLTAAKAISAEVLTLIKEIEGTYRYPAELLTTPNPKSLTSYPFGYLEETSRAHFWVRRDVQLERLIGRLFDPSNDAWTVEPDVLFVTSGAKTRIATPDNQLAKNALRSFIPQMLFGVVLSETGRDIVIGEDYNENFLPDEGTETRATGALEGTVWTGAAPQLNLRVFSSSGEDVGSLVINDPQFVLNFEAGAGSEASTTLTTGDMTGSFDPQDLVTIITDIAGIDDAGASNLVKQAYGIPSEDPLPESLTVDFNFTFSPAN